MLAKVNESKRFINALIKRSNTNAIAIAVYIHTDCIPMYLIHFFEVLYITD